MSSHRPHRARAKVGPPARVFVDSSAWLAFFSASDGKHGAADALFRRAAAQSIEMLTTNVVLAEVHRLLLFRAGPRPAAAALGHVDDSDRVAITFATEAHHQAAHAWLAKLGDQKVTYADAISFSVMDAERCRVAISFDHDFWLAGFEIWQA